MLHLSRLRPGPVAARCYCAVLEAFNQPPPGPKRRRLESSEPTGLFRIPELTSPAGFERLRIEAEERGKDLVREALSPQRSRKLVAVFDELSDTLCRVADMADCMRVLHPDLRHRQQAEDACASISRLVEELNTNRALFEALKDVVSAGGEPKFKTDAVDHRVSELLLADFELSGIHLDADKRAQFVEENNRAFNIGVHFMQGCSAPRRLKKSILAAPLRPDFASFSSSDDQESYYVSGPLSNSPNDRVREMGYRVFYHPDPNQEELLRAMLETRFNLAQLSDFSQYSDRATRHTMASNGSNVMEFLNFVRDHLVVDEELTLLRWLKREMGSKENLQMWDVPFLVRRARQRVIGIEPSALASFFSLGVCMEALRHLCVELFGVTFSVAETRAGELWHHDVYKIAFEHEDEGPLGFVYLDLFARPGKPEHDCHYTIRGGRQLSDGYQQPIVTLHLNLTAPQRKAHHPCLLSISEVENLFHEFGHALHSILGRTRYQHVTGTRTSTDFAEVPSTLMERFACDPRVLARYARHYSSGAPLAEEDMSKLAASRSLLMGVESKQHVMYAAFDQLIHGPHPLNATPSEIMRIVHNGYFPVDFVEGTAWHHRFSHLIGYGAKYYSYLAARAVAHSLWKTCFADDPFSRQSGERYRREILAFGGERSPVELFKNLTGEFLTTKAAAAGLIESIHSDNSNATRRFITGL